MLIVHIAEVAHEVNRAFCQSIGDDSQVPWGVCEQWQKDSAINGVIFKLRNPKSTPADVHLNWLKDKIEDGWKWGEVKNAEEKTHPCMVAYDQLPVEQRTKDHLFSAVVSTLKKHLYASDVY